MVISTKEFIDLCEGAFDMESQAAAISKSITARLNGYAEDNELSKTAVKEAYKAFKAFKSGKTSAQDEDYYTLQAIVEAHFSGENDGEDTISV